MLTAWVFTIICVGSQMCALEKPYTDYKEYGSEEECQWNARPQQFIHNQNIQKPEARGDEMRWVVQCNKIYQ